MSYFNRDNSGPLGCAAGCPCDTCNRAAGRLAETYETDDDDADAVADDGRAAPPNTLRGFAERAGSRPAAAAPGPGNGLLPSPAMARLIEGLRRGGAQLALQQLLGDGVRDENRMTDLLFFARHPERGGRRITPGDIAAAQEWRAIRERLVRPRLQAPHSAPGRAAPRPSPSPQQQQPLPRGACPIEDPLPQLRHPTGAPCSARGRKCWPALGKSLDLVDADLPCTADRNPAAYRAVLRYFNVADSANLRYARTPTSTFCNIFAHDATRALRASIPHWVRDERQRGSRPIGWNEISANSTFDWLMRAGPGAGWMPIDGALVDAVRHIGSARGAGAAVATVASRVLNSALTRLPTALAQAAERVARTTHADPSLLAQDSYLAQQFANLGYPTVVAWRNPSGRSGHIAMVAPESPASPGARHRSGMYLPRTTQAGARNFEDGIDPWIAGTATRGRRFFIHA